MTYGASGGNRLQLTQDGLVDIAWCQRVQAAGGLRFGYPNVARYDGNPQEILQLIQDASVPVARDLNHVLEFVRDLYRPTKWQLVCQPEAVPDWADNWEISKIVGTGSIKPASLLGPHDIPRGDISRTTTTGRMIEMINGFYYGTREMVKWARLGVNPSTERAEVQVQAADEFMDQLVATGDSFGLGFTGIANNADVDDTLVTLTTKASTNTAWRTAVAADFDLVLTDLHNITDAVYVKSKERHIADTMLMPLDEHNALNRLRPSSYSANALDTFMREWQAKAGKPVRIIVWDRLAAIGTVSTGPRIVAYNAASKNVAALMTGKSYGVDQVLEVTRGFEANASLVTGGVRILDQTGIVYADAHPG